MLYRKLVVGPLQCNCTILACEKTREAVVIDPGDEADKILAQLAQDNLTVKYLLHTHAHFDHIGGTGGVKAKAAAAQICLHQDDQMIYDNLPMQGKMFGMNFEKAPPVEKFLEDGERLTFGECRLDVTHTPGHSPGGVCLVGESDGEQWCFSGDTLFQQSVGRTDLWGGDMGVLVTSIKQRLFTLDDDTKVFPGHGPETSIGFEKRMNPFVR